MSRESISLRQRFRILMRDHFSCMYCGKRPPSVILNVDHYIPVSAGGSSDDRNLITSCRDCNSGKADVVPFEKHPKDRKERYWAAKGCTCDRPTCGDEGDPRDRLEVYCKCEWCHGCRTCGSTLCAVKEDGSCWFAERYFYEGNENDLARMKPEDAESCRAARRARLARLEEARSKDFPS